jgi:hypothetical protein
MAFKRREDQQAYARRHYEGDRERYLSRAVIQKAATQAILQAAILRYLEQHPCVDCGESDPVVLEFDHRDPGAKSFNIGAASTGSIGLERVRREIQKCDVRCANCHRRKTAKTAGYMRAILAQHASAVPGAPQQDVSCSFVDEHSPALAGAFYSVPGYGYAA